MSLKKIKRKFIRIINKLFGLDIPLSDEQKIINTLNNILNNSILENKLINILKSIIHTAEIEQEVSTICDKFINNNVLQPSKLVNIIKSVIHTAEIEQEVNTICGKFIINDLLQLIAENKLLKAKLNNQLFKLSQQHDVIPIFLASDDNYAPFLATCMFSILENTHSFIEFHILDNGITSQNKLKLEKSLTVFNYKEIYYHDMSEFDLLQFPNLRHYSLTAYCRYFIPQIYPYNNKVLYLDIDTIILGDIRELYVQNLENYALGSVLEDFYDGNYTYLKENIYPEYEGGDKYFNSGVLLIDLEKFNAMGYSKKLLETTVKYFDKLSTADQDVFNIVFQNNFKVLDYKFNFMPDYERKLLEKHPNSTIEPILLHYTNGKPWKNLSCRNKDFWNVLVCTAFKNDFLSELTNYWQ